MATFTRVFVSTFLFSCAFSARDPKFLNDVSDVNPKVLKGNSIEANKTVLSGDESWDFFLFVQTWDPELCAGYSGRSHDCVESIVGWTIHGLWPNRNDGSYPSYCKHDNNDAYDFNSLNGILDQLKIYWKNCFADTSLDHLWEHEYEKHGTCALQAKGIKSEHDYFGLGLELRSAFQIGKILSAAGIFPHNGMDVTMDEVNSAMSAHTGHLPWLSCNHASGGRQWLSQVGICISKDDRKPIPCPTQSRSCNSWQSMAYIPNPNAARSGSLFSKLHAWAQSSYNLVLELISV